MLMMTLGWTFVQFFLLEYLHANPPLIRSLPPLAYCVLALGRVPPTTYAENTLSEVTSQLHLVVVTPSY